MHGGRAVGRPVAVLLWGFVAMTTVSLGIASYNPLAANTWDWYASAKRCPGYFATVGKFLKWIDGIVSHLGSSCTPIICTDLNDGIGLARDGHAWVRVESSALGETRTRVELPGGAGALFRNLLERHHLSRVGSFYGYLPTYFAVSGSTSMIDHIALPEGSLHAVTKCGVLRRAGKRLRLLLIPSEANRDHVPLVVCFPYCCYFPSTAGSIRWNYDALMFAVREGTSRREFVCELESSFAASEKNWQACWRSTPPTHISSRLTGSQSAPHRNFSPRNVPTTSMTRPAKKGWLC